MHTSDSRTKSSKMYFLRLKRCFLDVVVSVTILKTKRPVYNQIRHLSVQQRSPGKIDTQYVVNLVWKWSYFSVNVVLKLLFHFLSAQIYTASPALMTLPLRPCTIANCSHNTSSHLCWAFEAIISSCQVERIISSRINDRFICSARMRHVLVHQISGKLRRIFLTSWKKSAVNE